MKSILSRLLARQITPPKDWREGLDPIRVGTWPTISDPPYQTPTYNTRPRPTISDPNVPYQTPIIYEMGLTVLCVAFDFMLTVALSNAVILYEIWLLRITNCKFTGRESRHCCNFLSSL